MNEIQNIKLKDLDKELSQEYARFIEACFNAVASPAQLRMLNRYTRIHLVDCEKPVYPVWMAEFLKPKRETSKAARVSLRQTQVLSRKTPKVQRPDPEIRRIDLLVKRIPHRRLLDSRPRINPRSTRKQGKSLTLLQTPRLKARSKPRRTPHLLEEVIESRKRITYELVCND